MKEQGHDTRFGGEGYGARGGEDGGSTVRLSFKLFADGTRVTRPRAKRREALTGKQRVRGVRSMDTVDGGGYGSGCRKGPAGPTKGLYEGYNTKPRGLFTRVPPGVRFLVASFRPDFAFLVPPSGSIRTNRFSGGQCSLER